MKTNVSNMRRSLSVASTFAVCAVAAVLLPACQTPNQVNTVPLQKVASELPRDWVDMAAGDSRLVYLDASTRKTLMLFRKEVAIEGNSPEFIATGGYSEPTLARWREINEECKKSYCANAVVIGRDLTPELAGTALSVNEAYMNSVVVGDVDLRQVQDDWARFWLMNKPSTLSPYPIVNTGGRP